MGQGWKAPSSDLRAKRLGRPIDGRGGESGRRTGEEVPVPSAFECRVSDTHLRREIPLPRGDLDKDATGQHAGGECAALNTGGVDPE